MFAACFYGRYQVLLAPVFIVPSVTYYRKSNLTFNGFLCRQYAGRKIESIPNKVSKLKGQNHSGN